MGPTPFVGEVWNQWISVLPGSITAQFVNCMPSTVCWSGGEPGGR
jgi:hypothetical protein